ncbi:ABC transporter ATP-binding protein [Microvirga pakistanensis]|uniref:ABC transporter ATP-binding protein n=1 Tax=Microvirga pakistanensis TaxID=1682650 RepID=UPI00106C1345|nr:sn-glycerol-3-phosphate ABC transporter ATP-binding protein UgpC [Microvirga pakistanensis]
MAQVSLRNVVKRYELVQVVHNINLEIADHEFVVLVGPSGCGKSTTLRMLAGLEEISSGEIYIDSRPVSSVPPWNRDIAMVFQNYALYPHMTVAENMGFGLKLRHVPKSEIQARVKHAADILGITNLLDRRPKALSGGQRQRVAMGRALVRDPKVFLFDEPLSNLDAKLRVQMRTEIKKLHQRVNTTTIYVTHDQVEAMTLADRVVVMNGGRIEQIGPPQELYHAPKSLFVAGFVGSPGMNFVPARVEESNGSLYLSIGNRCRLAVPLARTDRYGPFVGRMMTFGIRPEHISEPSGEPQSGMAPLELPVDVVEPMGAETLVHCNLDGTTVIACLEPSTQASPGKPIKLVADMNHMHLIDPETSLVV